MAWSEQIRAEALERAAQVGPVEAALELNIPPNTIKSWQKRARDRARRDEVSAAELPPLEGGSLMAQVEQVAREALAKARDCIASGRPAEAKSLAVGAAILADKVIAAKRRKRDAQSESLRAEVRRRLRDDDLDEPEGDDDD